MNVKACALLATAVILAGCIELNEPLGRPVANLTVLRTVYGDVGYAAGTDLSGARVIFASEGIADVVAAANSGTQISFLNLSVDEYLLFKKTSDSVLREGEVVIEGVKYRVLVVQDSREFAAVYELYDSLADTGVLVARGSPLGTIPVGQFNYTGTFFEALYDTSIRGDSVTNAFGTMTATLDFENATFTLDGNTPNISLTADGAIDNSKGLFSSNTAIIEDYGTSKSGRVVGQLHGQSAESISGIWYVDTGTGDDSSGGFLGTQN